jgi:hypothetical protein
MNQALDFYREDSRIQSISGYSLSVRDKNNEVYFQLRPGSWGWASWKDRWNPEIFNKEELLVEINFNHSVLREFKNQCGADISGMLMDSISGKNNSWYVRWAFSHFKTKRYAVYPAYSFVDNIGFGMEGTHCKNINCYVPEPIDATKTTFSFPSFITPSNSLNKDFLRYFTSRYKIEFRLKLAGTRKGRKKLAEEFFNRTGLNRRFKKS